MLVRLNLSTEDRWTELFAGFSLLHGPVTSGLLAEAQRSAFALVPEDSEDGPNRRAVEITRFLAVAVIRDWRGAVDDETGLPLPVTPETIGAVIDIWPVFRAFSEKIVDARVRVEREKKDLPPLQTGTSGAGPAIAPIATDPARTALPN